MRRKTGKTPSVDAQLAQLQAKLESRHYLLNELGYCQIRPYIPPKDERTPFAPRHRVKARPSKGTSNLTLGIYRQKCSTELQLLLMTATVGRTARRSPRLVRRVLCL